MFYWIGFSILKILYLSALKYLLTTLLLQTILTQTITIGKFG